MSSIDKVIQWLAIVALDNGSTAAPVAACSSTTYSRSVETTMMPGAIPRELRRKPSRSARRTLRATEPHVQIKYFSASSNVENLAVSSYRWPRSSTSSITHHAPSTRRENVSSADLNRMRQFSSASDIRTSVIRDSRVHLIQCSDSRVKSGICYPTFPRMRSQSIFASMAFRRPAGRCHRARRSELINDGANGDSSSLPGV